MAKQDWNPGLEHIIQWEKTDSTCHVLSSYSPCTAAHIHFSTGSASLPEGRIQHCWDQGHQTRKGKGESCHFPSVLLWPITFQRSQSLVLTQSLEYERNVTFEEEHYQLDDGKNILEGCVQLTPGSFLSARQWFPHSQPLTWNLYKEWLLPWATHLLPE